LSNLTEGNGSFIQKRPSASKGFHLGICLEKIFIRHLMWQIIVGAINMIPLSIDEHSIPHVIVPRYELLRELRLPEHLVKQQSVTLARSFASH
jgi:hypothetical protein